MKKSDMSDKKFTFIQPTIGIGKSSSMTIKKPVLAIDVSYSMVCDRPMLMDMLAGYLKLFQMLGHPKTRIIIFDAEVHEDQTVSDISEFELTEGSRGGTDLAPVHEALKSEDVLALFVITDGWLPADKVDRPYEVVYLLDSSDGRHHLSGTLFDMRLFHPGLWLKPSQSELADFGGTPLKKDNISHP